MAHPDHRAGAPSRDRAPAVALLVAMLSWLVAALAIGLIAASHAWTSGCRVDGSLRGAGTLCLVLAGLLGAGAAVTGLLRLRTPRRRPLAVAAAALGAGAVLVCLVLFLAETSPHAVNPAYLHPC